MDIKKTLKHTLSFFYVVGESLRGLKFPAHTKSLFQQTSKPKKSSCKNPQICLYYKLLQDKMWICFRHALSTYEFEIPLTPLMHWLKSSITTSDKRPASTASPNNSSKHPREGPSAMFEWLGTLSCHSTTPAGSSHLKVRLTIKATRSFADFPEIKDAITELLSQKIKISCPHNSLWKRWMPTRTAKASNSKIIVSLSPIVKAPITFESSQVPKYFKHEPFSSTRTPPIPAFGPGSKQASV